jgi:hypothetical protein
MAKIYLEFMSLKLLKGSVPGLSKTGDSGFASPPEEAHVGRQALELLFRFPFHMAKE